MGTLASGVSPMPLHLIRQSTQSFRLRPQCVRPSATAVGCQKSNSAALFRFPLSVSPRIPATG